jgi:predicted RNase H-like HicB family nuclease
MKLTAHISKAADGRLDLHVVELPDLVAHARSVEDIPEAVRDAATQLTGRPRTDFHVEVRY